MAEQNNILFIDDEPAVLDALEWTFADEPYECLTCKSPDEAFKLMEKMDFAVVVSDQRMGHMSGTDFLEKIKYHRPSTIRILMTAYQEMNILLDAVNKGHIYNIVFKPWDEDELKQVIKTAVEDYTFKNGERTSGQFPSETERLLALNKSLEEKNQYLIKRLQQAQKMEALGKLSCGIAHDFNNTLFVIDGNLRLLMLDSSLTPAIQNNLTQVLEASNKAKELVSQILRFSRSGNDNRNTLKLGPLVKEVVEFLQTAFPKIIQIRQHIEVEHESIKLEATKVYQILMNLCLNAADAIQDSKGTIDVSLKRTRIDKTDQIEKIKLLAGDYFILQVKDNGHGIEPANLEQIFDPYFTTKSDSGGTGLGLALINQIVQDHGGRILVESEIDEGTAFTVYLPLTEL